HSVGGFYTYVFLIFFASTGLVWTYGWWSDGIYRLLGNDPEEVFQRPEYPAFAGDVPLTAMDRAWQDALSRHARFDKLYFSIPSPKRDKGVISTTIYYPSSSWWETSDRYYYHPETGELYHSLPHEEKLLGEKWRNSNYAMHVGSIYGIPSKIIASLCALFFATLPITGFLIWWGRKYKKKRKPTKLTRSRSRKPLKVNKLGPLPQSRLAPANQVNRVEKPEAISTYQPPKED
ncbi:MAG: PepSY-associated TM helix domain-containing protein, partial [Bacteroidota bacterium]